MAEAIIALGSNISPRKKYLAKAVKLLEKLPQCQVTRKSSIYETPPLGGLPQNMYLNAALVLKSKHAPKDLMHDLLEIEENMGRKRTYPNAPRIIDLDIIFYNKTIYSDPQLSIPHPRYKERGFVLLPLHDIIPSFVDPQAGKSVATLLEEWYETGGESYLSVGSL